jgi:uncharacterized membrane protein YcfT
MTFSFKTLLSSKYKYLLHYSLTGLGLFKNFFNYFFSSIVKGVSLSWAFIFVTASIRGNKTALSDTFVIKSLSHVYLPTFYLFGSLSGSGSGLKDI